MPEWYNDGPSNGSISAVVKYTDASPNVMSHVWLRSVLTWWNNPYIITVHCIVYNFTTLNQHGNL